MILEKKIPLKYVFNSVKYDLLFVLLVGLFTNYLASQFKSLLPEMPLPIPAFLGMAISILLLFKMNQSDDRWREARKVWGSIVNDSRSFVLQLQSFLDNTQTGNIKKMAYRQMGWYYALGKSLRGLDFLTKTTPFISETVLHHVAAHQNKPLAILQLNARARTSKTQ